MGSTRLWDNHDLSVKKQDKKIMRYFFSQRHILPPKDWGNLYKKVRPFYWQNKDPILIKKVFEKPPKSFATLTTKGYLAERDPRRAADHYDNAFLDFYHPPTKVYGYHDGTFFSFCPYFSDVIKYGEEVIRDSDVCFVTTQPVDLDGNLASHSDFYNASTQMCYGVTHFYPFRRELVKEFQNID